MQCHFTSHRILVPMALSALRPYRFTSWVSTQSMKRCTIHTYQGFRRFSLCDLNSFEFIDKKRLLLSCGSDDSRVPFRRFASSRQVHDGRPPGIRLADSILGRSEELLAATSDETKKNLFAEGVFKRLRLDQPTSLPSRFACTSSYHDYLARLVVEETMHTVANAVERKGLSSKKEDQPKTRTIPIHVVSDTKWKEIFECFTYKPLSRSDRKKLRAGAVIALTKSKAESSLNNIVLGIIKYGSNASQLLPATMSRGSKDKAESNDESKGDRLCFEMFGEYDIEPGDDLEIHYLATILNFQRQFAACQEPEKNANFDGEILGKAQEDTTNFEDPFTSPVDDSLNSVQKINFGGQSAGIHIPPLNEAQQQVSDQFFSDKDRKIHIVQGPPGTGKTTTTVSIICRYLVESQALNLNRKLLVCGPTNKSVVVIAQKVLSCIRNNDSVNAVLIGDKVELLSDGNEGLQKWFVYSYINVMLKEWKKCGNQLLRSGDLVKYQDDTNALLVSMKKKLWNTSLSSVEYSLESVVKSFEESEKDAEDGAEAALLPEIQKEALRNLSLEIRRLDEQSVVQDLLNGADLIFCTLSSSASMAMRRACSVNDIIVDEASACTEAELLVPLYKKPERLLLVGDPKQLPATVISPLATKYNFKRSLQDRLMFENQYDFNLLNVQYRMRPEISKWLLSKFYNEKVQDGENVAEENYQSDVALLSGEPYCWVQVSGNEKKDKNFSTYNELEAETVVAALLHLKESYNLSKGWFSPDRLRVITFYNAQVDYIRFLLRKYELDVAVSSVDASQGSEADLVILSFVRGTSGHVGFLKDDRRLNVALSRAKFQLVCIGNLEAISGLEEKGGNLTIREMAVDALERAQIFTEPLPLPPPPPSSMTRNKRSSRKGIKPETKKKRKNKKKV